VKPLPFRYLAPRSLDEALEALASHGDDAKVIAGGQSLGPLLNLRLASPSVLVDLNHVSELGGEPIADGESVTIGAMTRQRDAERSALLASACPLFTEALPYVAHRTIRNRGTVGGSLAHADPAAELPAVAVAVGAQLTALSVRGKRVVPAGAFFDGYFTTALEADEILCAIRLPKIRDASGSAWEEFAPRHGDFAIVGVAATVRLDENGAVAAASVVCSGVADVPKRAGDAEDAVLGRRLNAQTLAAAGAAAAAGCHPPDDLVGSTQYRRHLVALLTVRALRTAADRAREGQWSRQARTSA
jgi:carbon-monoxide dehydrogenase medium subunit